MHDSINSRWLRADEQHITQRSWLKLLQTTTREAGERNVCEVSMVKPKNLSMTKIPPPSSPRVFSIGILTLSKVIKAVPADGE